jgi:hypothetical protein
MLMSNSHAGDSGPALVIQWRGSEKKVHFLLHVAKFALDPPRLLALDRPGQLRMSRPLLRMCHVRICGA